MSDASYLPAAHPAFARHFTDPLYLDPAANLAPFPSSDSFAIIEEWLDRGIPATSTLREVIEATFEDDEDGIPFAEWDEDNETVDMAVIDLGFLLLRVNGRLEPDGMSMMYSAIERQQRRFGRGGFAALTQARADLESFQQ